MIKLDEDALISDLAETYHIYDYKQLPLQKVAAFSCHLRNDSRIKMKLNHQVIPMNTQIVAGIYDVVNLLWWSKTKDAEHGTRKPTSILTAIMGNQKKQSADTTITFDSGKDFEQIRHNLISGGDDNGD